MTISRRTLPAKTLVSAQVANTATFTAATTDVITSTAHGLSNGDVVSFSNSGGALPAGLSSAIYYYVIEAATNTFEVSATKGGTAVDITGTGTGTHTYYKEVFTDPIMVEDFQYTGIGIVTSSSTAATIFSRCSIANTAPNYAAASTEDSRHYPFALIDTEDVSSEQGDTGIVLTGTDISDLLQVNVDIPRYVQIRTSQFSVGSITIEIKSAG